MSTYAEGVQQVLDGTTNVFFGDRAILLDAKIHNDKGKNLQVLVTVLHVRVARAAMARGDRELLLAVDRSLSRLYWTQDFRAMYVKWFGNPNMNVMNFYRWNALPE